MSGIPGLGVLSAAIVGETPGGAGAGSEGGSSAISEREGKIGGIRADKAQTEGDVRDTDRSEKEHSDNATSAYEEAQKAGIEAQKHEQKINELSDQITAIDGQIQNLETSKTGKKPEEIEAIDKQIATLKQKQTQLKAELEKEKTALEAARAKQLEELEKALTELMASKADAEKKGSLEEKVKELESKIDELQKEIDELRSKQAKQDQGTGGAEKPQPQPQQLPNVDLPPPPVVPGADQVPLAQSLLDDSNTQFATALGKRVEAEQYAANGDMDAARDAAHAARAAADKAVKDAQQAEQIANQFQGNKQLKEIADKAKQNAENAKKEAEKAENAAGLPHPESKPTDITKPAVLSGTPTAAPAEGTGGGSLGANVATWNQVKTTV